MKQIKTELLPAYGKQGWWEAYEEELMVEYQQCVEEGKQIEAYQPLFAAVSQMPAGEHKEKMANVLFDLQMNLPRRQDYPYQEPDELEAIHALRPAWQQDRTELPDEKSLADRIYGAWLGRTCGCLLGKPIEGIHTDELHPLLQESGNWPMHRYIVTSDISQTRKAASRFGFDEPHRQCWADLVECAPADDDTNYTVLYQQLIERFGRNFNADQVAEIWMDLQPKTAYCTAERVAFCNFAKGFRPPESAQWHNPYREWIGAQIRGDYFGYINPGNPELAAEMAWRDASVSHVKNGIYGEMFASAMIAQAAVEKDLTRVVQVGLAQIPATSRLYEAVSRIVTLYLEGKPQQACCELIHGMYDEKTTHGWCHTVPNAMIVAMALLYGHGDYGTSICMAVQTGFDTDCNGATVGSVIGMLRGSSAIGEAWRKPVNDQVDTAILGVGRIRLRRAAEMTLKHLK